MLKFYFTLPIIIMLAISMSAQNKDFTVHKNGITFPNGKNLTDPINAKMDLPPGGPNLVFADIPGITGDATFNFCDECVEIYAFDAYIYRSLGTHGNPNGAFNKPYFVLSKKATGATDQLLNLFKNNTIIPSIAIKHYSSNSGQPILVYTVEITNSLIAEYRIELQYVAADATYLLIEKYYFFYDELSFKQGTETAVVLD